MYGLVDPFSCSMNQPTFMANVACSIWHIIDGVYYCFKVEIVAFVTLSMFVHCYLKVENVTKVTVSNHTFLAYCNTINTNAVGRMRMVCKMPNFKHILNIVESIILYVSLHKDISSSKVLFLSDKIMVAPLF